MTGALVLDIVLVLALAAYVSGMYRTGLVAGAFSLIGFLGDDVMGEGFAFDEIVRVVSDDPELAPVNGDLGVVLGAGCCGGRRSGDGGGVGGGHYATVAANTWSANHRQKVSPSRDSTSQRM